jgi:glycine dehydrogenase subunit 1
MPGRIVGKTVDVNGRPGYVMTLVTREQYIRRERSTSNICTSEALLALAAAVYLATLGKRGLRKVAELCYHKSHYAAKEISGLRGYSLAFRQPFFKEFVVNCPVTPGRINQALMEEKIIGGLDVSHMVKKGLLYCVTEMNSREEIDKLVKILGKFQGG